MEFPEATCKECGKLCEASEIQKRPNGTFFLWCYCPDCQLETNHEPTPDSGGKGNGQSAIPPNPPDN